MKHTKLSVIGVSLCIAMLMSSALAAAADDASDEPEPTEPAEPTVPVNETQADKAARLSEASGETIEKILEMRSGSMTGDTVPDEPDTDEPDTGEPDTDEPDLPQGRGWGVIAKFLGLHPGILGKGTGEKFYPAEDSDSGADDEDGIVAARERVRKERLFNEDEEIESADQESSQKALSKCSDVAAARQEEKIERKAERAKNKDVVRDRTKTNSARGKGSSDDKGNKGKSEGKGNKGKSGK